MPQSKARFSPACNVSRSVPAALTAVPLLQSVKLHLPKNAKFGDVVNSQPQDYNFKGAAAPPVVCECAAQAG